MASFEKIQALYRAKWGSDPLWVVRCPGRVNLIGEHVDYSDYSVLPMATQESTFIALGPCTEPQLVLESIEPEKYPSFVYQFPTPNGSKMSFAGTEGNRWHNYFLAGWRGILEHLAKNPQQEAFASPKGMYALVGSSIPPSAGISSSSALVCAASLATLVNQTGDSRMPKSELAEVATHAERWVGTEGGGMDQACECLAEHGSALRIDFRPLKHTAVRLPDSALFAVLHSGTEHRLSDNSTGTTSHYNERVVECRLAAQVLAKRSGKLQTSDGWKSVRTLRQAAALYGYGDQPVAMLQWVREHLRKDEFMSPHSRAELCALLECSDAELAEHSLSASTQWMREFWLAKRAEHVYDEAARVFEFQRVCDQKQHNLLGEEQALRELARLMNASHKSCRDLFECSCEALDATVAKCLAKGCLAARLTGAGWGGCAVALVEKSKKEEVEAAGLEVLFWSEPSSGIEAVKVAPQ